MHLRIKKNISFSDQNHHHKWIPQPNFFFSLLFLYFFKVINLIGG